MKTLIALRAAMARVAASAANDRLSAANDDDPNPTSPLGASRRGALLGAAA